MYYATAAFSYKHSLSATIRRLAFEQIMTGKVTWKTKPSLS